MQLGGIEKRDDHDGGQVIHDRDGSQEDLQRTGHARPQQREHTQREGYVGRRRDRPARPGFGDPAIEREIDQRRQDNTPQRRHTGQES